LNKLKVFLKNLKKRLGLLLSPLAFQLAFEIRKTTLNIDGVNSVKRGK